MRRSSRRVPRAIVTACSPAVSQTRTPTASPSSTSAGKPCRPPGRVTVRGRDGMSKLCIPWRARARRGALQARRQLRPQLIAQRVERLARREHRPVLVLDAEGHPQVRGQIVE